MQIPSSLEGWTSDLIVELAGQGVSEPAAFDFKAGAALYGPKGAESLSKAAGAFANAGGGFLVIGVDEDGPHWNPTGVPKDREVNKKLNDRIKLFPALSYPAPRELEVPGDPAKAFYVVQVPASDGGPYASMATELPLFFERTHSGSVPMSWNRIRDRMMRVEERRAKGAMLVHEILQHLNVCRAYLYGPKEQGDIHVEPFELSTTRRLFEDLFPVAGDNTHWVNAASASMRMMNQLNAMLEYQSHRVASAILNKGAVVADAKNVLAGRAKQAWDRLNEFYVFSGEAFGIPTGKFQGP